jgi:hypothetical protein
MTKRVSVPPRRGRFSPTTLTALEAGPGSNSDFFRIEDGLIAEHWESVDWVRAYQSFGLLPDDVRDA